MINCFLLTFLDPLDKGNVGSLHHSHTHTDHVPRFTFTIVELANFCEYMEEVRREVEEMSEMKRYPRALQPHIEIVTPITPLIVEDMHQRMLQAVEKFQGLERRSSLKLQELDKGEATQRQWSSQLEKLTAATTALEVARKEAEDRAEGRVTAEVDALQKEVRLAKAEAIAEVTGDLARWEARASVAEVRADARVAGSVLRLEERALQAKSRAEARASR